tara:strand:+ start:1007 stop:1576 length:570 start_codon:yes stop_codon:yes gene_type:complete
MNTLPQEAETHDDLKDLIMYLRDGEHKDERAVRTLVNDILQELYPTPTPLHSPDSYHMKEAIKLDRYAIRQIIISELDNISPGDSTKDLNEAIDLLLATIADVIPSLGSSPDEGKLKESGEWHLEQLKAARNDNITADEKKSVINKVLNEFRYKTIDDPKNLIGDAIQNISVEVATLAGAALISDADLR